MIVLTKDMAEIQIPDGIGMVPLENYSGGGDSWTLILYNNSTKQSTLIENLADEGNSQYYSFTGLDFSEFPSGEYQYFLFWNELTGVTYDFKNVPLDTLVTVGEETFKLSSLNPETGLFKIVDGSEEKTTYEKDVEFVYYKK